jgi:dTDP-4-dehydrorhamnose reductase
VRVLILGSDGMLGHVVTKFLIKQDLDLWFTGRSVNFDPGNKSKFIKFDAKSSIESTFSNLGYFDYVINCIGIIKPNIDEKVSSSVLNAIEINSRFPHLLSNFFNDSKILQIATDCVYSGLTGNYLENSIHDPQDVYGKTKSLGEVSSTNFMNIRTSIIGREIRHHKSLWDWVIRQEKDSPVNGFTNHLWNGVTTLAFAKLVTGIMLENLFQATTQHVIPKNLITKDVLLQTILVNEGRSDVKVNPIESSVQINRTLSTQDPNMNEKLWLSAGYQNVPTIEQLIEEFSSWYQ